MPHWYICEMNINFQFGYLFAKVTKVLFISLNSNSHTRYIAGQLQANQVESLEEKTHSDVTSDSVKKTTSRQRKILAFIVPGLVCHFGWWALMIKMNLWHFFVDKYYMTLTMIIGSMIAGK